jgi:AcrR family transcriptional regulator
MFSVLHSTDRRQGPPRGPRAEAREQAILDAALELLKEVGYDRLSIDALAERARAGKATIYRHWSGKAEIVVDAIRRRQCQAGVAPNTGSLRGDLVAVVTGMADTLASEDGALIAGVLRAMQTDPELAGLVQSQMLSGMRDGFGVILERAVRRGELVSAEHAEVAHETLSSMVKYRVILSDQPVTPEFTAHLVDDIVLPLLQR